jgi:hypothetical protein
MQICFSKTLLLLAKHIVPEWGYKVNCGIGLSFRPDRLNSLAGLYKNRNQLYPPVRDYEFGYRTLKTLLMSPPPPPSNRVKVCHKHGFLWMEKKVQVFFHWIEFSCSNIHKCACASLKQCKFYIRTFLFTCYVIKFE